MIETLPYRALTAVLLLVFLPGPVAAGGERKPPGKGVEVKLYLKITEGGKVRSSPAIAGGKLYIGSDDGFVYCFSGK